MLVFLLMSQCIFVYFPSRIKFADATEPDALCPQRPKLCIECSTQQNDHYCADPFNLTLLEKKQVTLKECKKACVKWVKKAKDTGTEQYIRTCSDNLRITMQINMVCIRESRSGYGHMCFCNKDRCNSASNLSVFWHQAVRCHPCLFLLILVSWVILRRQLVTPLTMNP